MTSGNFVSIFVDDIIVAPGRVRKTFKQEDIDALADSIRRLGLIHPPVVGRDLLLVAGERRLRAVRSLGWDTIPVQWADDLSPHDLLALELEENIKRSDLTWQEQVDSLLRLHELRLTEDPSWTQEQTAAAVGIAKMTVSDQLAVAKELRAANPKVKDLKEYSVARGIVKRQTERKQADEVASIAAVLDMDGEIPPPPETPILTADFLEWVRDYSGQPFNLIHCDYPYGINADKFNQGSAEARGGYEDTPEIYWNLIHALVSNKDKLLGDSGHVIFWFSMRYYSETLQALRANFWVDSYPLIWFKSDNTGTLPDPSRGPRRVYEAAFLCSHGDRKIIQSVANTFAAPVTRLAEHMSEKSQPMLEHFMRMVVDPHTRILDPTCGSGSALRAARALGAGHIVGLEKNPDFAELAREAWRK